jgi:geranylgeranyl diphosphate synthase type II
LTAALPRDFAAFAARWRERVEQALENLLPTADAAPRELHAAMRYAMFPGGKRLRPMLSLLGCVATGGDPERALVPSAAIECLHTYSLVHDDLPCMDDDDLRRGRPTCHKVHGEAMAVLAGDALLTLSFAGVAEGGAAAVRELALASGSQGMVGGQAEDVLAEDGRGERTLERVQWIHDHKTGALIRASLLVGAHAGGDGELPAALLAELGQYGLLLGRAFQVADDCLDLTATAEEMGKDVRADACHDKLTYPSVLGLLRSQQVAAELARSAAAVAPRVTALAAAFRPGMGPALDGATTLLQDCALFAIRRRN